IPSLALPLSVVGTFAAMQPLGYSLDNLSLMALTLSIGFVVDDAIVILENIVRHKEMGKAPVEDAYDGAAEIGITIIAITLSLPAMTGLLFVQVPKGFIPNEDQGFVFTVVEAAEGVSFEQMTRLQLAVTDIVRADPSVEELFSSISASSASTGSTLNQGRMF